MPHVDEGTLHAYLDGAIDSLIAAGALPADQTRGEIDAHLGSCADCRSLYEAERAVREQSGNVLRAAELGPIAVPPFSDIRTEWVPRTPEIVERSRSYIPMAWAASVMLAVGAGWMGSAMVRSGESETGQAKAIGAALEVDATPPIAGDVPQRFRAAIDSARSNELEWRTVAYDDPEAQALGVVNVEGATDLSVSIATLPSGLGSIARVQQRLDTGEPFEMLVWREPVQVAAALEVLRDLRSTEAASRSASVASAARPQSQSAGAHIESNVISTGASMVLARVRDDRTYVAIQGAMETSRLSGLADRLVDVRF